MKLKKVAALCSRSGTFYLFDQVSENGEVRQWLGDGRSMYPLSGLPPLNDENLCAMFDIPERRREKCSFRQGPMPPALNVEDWEPGERALSDDWPTVQHNGYVIKPLSTREGITFIQTAYLAPLEDMADYLQLYERVDADGGTYIVAKNGLELAAVIMPVDAIELGFVEQIEALAHKCRMALEARRGHSREDAMDSGQGTLFQGDAAGEGQEGAGPC